MRAGGWGRGPSPRSLTGALRAGFETKDLHLPPPCGGWVADRRQRRGSARGLRGYSDPGGIGEGGHTATAAPPVC
ncbi:hypothetical protein NDU88_007560 [Pleurodeles waltl]|uniref:Uncharacterized protein n=1 Tax=Pleurodeles waltl TaxID=8319 RepID=A0AAV7U0U1_PLEWA|nr:hypothetical protein NDU88_007560 [Pleurodeles waltl]